VHSAALLVRVAADGALLLKVAARPGASRSELTGLAGDAVRVALAAPPEKGKANRELVRVLAKALGVRRPQVTLVTGATSRDKTMRVEGLDEGDLRARLAEALE
jgi:uncharacterized protein